MSLAETMRLPRCICAIGILVPVSAILYPRESISRDVRSLDGVWSFRISPPNDTNAGFDRSWFGKRLSMSGSVIDMPVPSSYNDITADKSVRDFIGWAWYDRSFFVPRHWSQKRVVLRFGSVNYLTKVYINGKHVVRGGRHEGGHLPFEMDISQYLKFGWKHNWVTVAVNNTLTPHTIPQGRYIIKNDEHLYPPGYVEQKYNFVYYHYAGIHRSVYLYTTPTGNYIEDIKINTNFSGSVTQPTAYIAFKVFPGLPDNSIHSSQSNKSLCRVRVFDKHDQQILVDVVYSSKSFYACSGMITLRNATLWWPYKMSEKPGFLYQLEVSMFSIANRPSSDFIDTYTENFGIRTINWDKNRVYINDKPLYLHGFGKHEDADIVGRGLHIPLMVKDINLLKWTGANVFRTSHYPYAEELLDLTDKAGILVIAESPAIGLQGFAKTLLDKHLSIMRELVTRDKNRPSVFMWSLGNEPVSSEKAAGPYFQSVYNFTRNLDFSRPITTVLSEPYSTDKAAAPMDVILINRYYSWYTDSGRTEVIQRQIVNDIHNWRKKFNKPVGVSEYGAGSVVGLRDLPEFIWTEDYQAVFLEEFMKGFDTLRKNDWFLGEMVWNFADFLVPPDFVRPKFCMKGVFTRNRKPKLAAYIVRNRYQKLI